MYHVYMRFFTYGVHEFKKLMKKNLKTYFIYVQNCKFKLIIV
jgi:hypothetical protein